MNIMTYKEAREYIDLAAKSGSVYGLESIERLLDKLSNPQDKLKIIHVAGTNGKGSTICYISTILDEAGYKVGRYISPTVVAYRERIQINGEYISKESFAKCLSKVVAAVEEIKEAGYPVPTAFEMETAIAFMYFLEEGCDIAVIETGLGGTMDATNVIKKPLCCVIASISMDHMGILGNSLYDIATNKAGIIKEGAKVISIAQDDEVCQALSEGAAKNNCHVIYANPDNVYNADHEGLTQRFSYKGSKNEYKDIVTNMSGIYQRDNAILAIEAVESLRELGYAITDKHIYNGIKRATWFGRFTKIMDNPLFIVDGAHNDGAAIKLKSTIDLYFTNRKKVYIMGVLADKEYNNIISRVLTENDTVITVTPDNSRALSASELANVLKDRVKKVYPLENIKDAVKKSIELADEDSVIIAFGSLYYLGDVIKAVDELKESVI